MPPSRPPIHSHPTIALRVAHCALCHCTLKGRGDDNAEVLKKRLETYATQTKPVLDAYEAAGYIRKVDSGRDVDVVFADVCKVCDAAIDTAGNNSDDDAQVSKDGSSAFPSFAPTTMLYVLAFAALAVGISRALNK